MLQFNTPPAFEHGEAANALFQKMFILKDHLPGGTFEMETAMTPQETDTFINGVQTAHQRQLDPAAEIVSRRGLRRFPSLARFDVDEVERHGYLKNSLLEVTMWACQGQDSDRRTVIGRGLHMFVSLQKRAAPIELSLLQINPLGKLNTQAMELASSTAQNIDQVLKTTKLLETIMSGRTRPSLGSHLRIVKP